MWSKLHNGIVAIFLWLLFPHCGLVNISEAAIDKNDPVISAILDKYQEKEYQRVVEMVDSVLVSDYQVNKARLFIIKADALYFLNDVETSLEYYLKTIDALADYQLDTVHLIESYSHTGFCYEYLGKYVEAIPYYHKSLAITRSADDSIEIANQLSHLGILYSHLGEYVKATDYLNEAYIIDIAIKDTVGISYDYINFGDLKNAIGDYELAIDYYRKGLAINRTRAGNHNTRALRLGRLANAYLLAGQYDSANLYSAKSVKEAKRLGDSLSLAKFYITQSQIQISLGDHKSAMQIATLSYDYFRRRSEGEFLILSAFALVDAYMELDNYEQADQLLSECVDIAKRNQLLDDLSQVYLRKSRLHEELGQDGLALSYLRQHQKMDDSVKTIDQQKAIFVIDQEHKAAQQKQEIELLKARDALSQLQLEEKRKNVITLTFILAMIALIAGLSYLVVQKRSELKSQLLTSQVNELRLQIKGIVEGSTDEMGITMNGVNSAIEEPLSEREFEILSLAITDLSNTDIAEKTFVSVNTVKYHLKNIYEKLGVSNRKEAMQFALRSAKTS